MKQSRFLIFALLLSLMIPAFAIAEQSIPTAAKVNPVVTVEGGKLIGYRSGASNIFLGVRYAKANRFEMPTKVEPWEGYKYAQAYGNVCLIPEIRAVSSAEILFPHRYWVESDDCQNLNIWTPTLESEAKKPVIVFYHGGGFRAGSAIESYAYEGQNLSEYGDAVVVTVNHRLNTLAFLDLSSFGDKYVNSANSAAADMVASLEWIRDNIAQFGGDPDNVTIFGQSAGGREVMVLMRTPTAAGLFHKAGVFSAGGHIPFQYGEGSTRVGELTAELLGLTAETIDEIQTFDYDQLYAASQEALARAREEGYNYTLYPSGNGGHVMPELCDWIADIPVIYGTTFSEFNPTISGDGRYTEWTAEETAAKLTERYGDKSDALLEEFHRIFPSMRDADLFYYDIVFHEGALIDTELMLDNTNSKH